MTIEVRELSKSFSGRKILSGVCLSVESGDLVAVTGPSGSGKSTLLHCVAGLEQPDSGQVLVQGRRVPAKEGRAMQKFRADLLGYLFQDFALVPEWTAVQNVMAARQRGFGRPQCRDQACQALEDVRLAEATQNLPVSPLSGGEQQRVAMARLIYKKPSIILADEPTGSLDRKNGELVTRVLRHLADAGASVMVVTHSEHVARACDHEFRLGSVSENDPL